MTTRFCDTKKGKKQRASYIGNMLSLERLQDESFAAGEASKKVLCGHVSSSYLCKECTTVIADESIAEGRQLEKEETECTHFHTRKCRQHNEVVTHCGMCLVDEVKRATLAERERIKKIILKYHWHDDNEFLHQLLTTTQGAGDEKRD